MYPHQAERLDGARARLGVDALVATSVANVAYLTGFRSLSREVYPATEVFAVYAKSGTALVIPAIDAPAFTAGDATADHVACYGRFYLTLAERADAAARRAAALAAGATTSAAEALASVLSALGLTRGAVGLDDGALTAAGARAVADRLKGVKLQSATEALAEARLVKGPYEIDCLQRALHIAEESIHEVLGELKPGTTEREAAALYESALARRDARPSATIIAFGPNAALPAAFPGDRALRPGDLVRFDLGCVFKGYHADVARTAVLGEPTPRQQALYDAVDAGVDAAVASIRPGAAARVVFDAAIAAVRAAGISEFRRHHVGHGIGLEPAERPWLAADGPSLEAGMVLRVETPYYELGTAGVHVKDTVLVNRSGAAVMNRSNRGLIVLD
jgi:Xaa-Pro dipeptidase